MKGLLDNLIVLNTVFLISLIIRGQKLVYSENDLNIVRQTRVPSQMACPVGATSRRKGTQKISPAQF
jgi:hypothetical protein